MKIVKNQDIWVFRDNLIRFKSINPVIVIPTNLGWKSNGDNVMGAGLAKQAVTKFSVIAREYGLFCQSVAKDQNRSTICLMEISDFKFLMFPTKSLDVKNPHLSWKQNSSLDQIERSCIDMINFDIDKSNETYLMPMVGCGNGKLDIKEVILILRKYFNHLDNIILFLNN